MSGTPETLVDIAAEIRHGERMFWSLRDCAAYADRIEAAAERERVSAPVNAAAMREALELAIDAIQELIALYDEEHSAAVKVGATWKRSDTSAVDAIVAKARSALAAPARNCDRFATAEEALAAFADHLRAWENAHGICSEYPDHPVKVPAGAFAWLFDTPKDSAQ